MALCSFSSKLAMEGYTVIDNTFLNEFLPQATGDDVKVYLFCYSLCFNPNYSDNSLDTVGKVLSLTEEQVKKSLNYWQEMGLVQIVSSEPFEVRFLPIRVRSGSGKLRKTEKYLEFNEHISSIISGRMITPTEFNEYYSLIETYHFEPEAVILIAKYCTTLKSDSIGYPYILAVARDFASEGIKTAVAVEQKFLEQEKSSAEIKQVLDALGIRRSADIDERNLYLKWVNNFGFTQGVIVEIAKLQKKRGGFSKLDESLTKYYEQKLFTLEEIQTFSKKRDEMFETAKQVCKNLGVYYQSYENVVDTYIVDWTNKGYEGDALMFIGNYCFRQSIRTLDGMNVIISKFYKLGLVSLESINQYISQVIENDELIRQILDTLGLVRSVSSYDRDMFRTWTENWGFSHNQIVMIAKWTKGKNANISYMNKVLSSLDNLKIRNDEEIKKYLEKSTLTVAKKADENIIRHDYSKEQLDAVYDNLDDVEI